MRARVSSAMPVPVSSTQTSTHPGSAGQERSTRVPPPSRDSKALTRRFRNTFRISRGSSHTGGNPGSSSWTTRVPASLTRAWARARQDSRSPLRVVGVRRRAAGRPNCVISRTSSVMWSISRLILRATSAPSASATLSSRCSRYSAKSLSPPRGFRSSCATWAAILPKAARAPLRSRSSSRVFLRAMAA